MVGEVNINQFGIQPRALYHLEDVSDSSGRGFNLTNNNSVTFSAGKFRNAANLGASNTNKNLVYTAGNIMSASTFTDGTIMCWYNPNGVPATNTNFNLVGVQTALGTGGAQFTLQYRDTGGTKNVGFFIALTGGNGQGSYNITLPQQQWTHLAFVKTATVIGTLYINGTPVASNSGTGVDLSFAASTNYLNIGSDRDNTSYASGMIDEVIITESTLNAKQIKEYYAWAIGRRTGVV